LPKQKSKKPSASSNSPAQPDLTRFIDRCAWSRRLGDALKEAGIPFVAHHDKFAPACPDEEWLRAVGKEGWIVVTRDQRIRSKANELKAFRDAKLIVFALASGNASAADTAALVVDLYPKFLKLARGTKPPAMFSGSLKQTITPVRS